MEYLVVLEVSQKQAYIFKTNRLAENIGASIIIRDITENISEQIAENFFGEKVLSGGGKSVYAFSNEERARDFTKGISNHVLLKYPGVELFLATCAYEEEHESIIDAINSLYGKLEQKKSGRESSFKVFDLGMGILCDSTGLPAVTQEKKSNRYLSAESQIKVQVAAKEQDEIFRELLPDSTKYRFAKEFKELGVSKNVKDYIGIIVMDGNKMGKKIEKVRNEFKKSHPIVNKQFNMDYKIAMCAMSRDIDQAYKKAVKSAICSLTENLERLKKKKLNIVEDGSKTVLPIRPLILAGDDICLVTDARIAISFARLILENIEKITEDDIPALHGQQMRACGGIALVKEKYPFFRGQELAEELCSKAKSIIEEDEDVSVLDFHVVQGEIEGSITEIRMNKYNQSTLTSKPYYIHDYKNASNCFSVFDAHMKNITSENIGRGTMKQYRDALMQGEQAARLYVTHKRLDRTNTKNVDKKLKFDSYINGKCIDFDVIEVMDMYLQVEDKK